MSKNTAIKTRSGYSTFFILISIVLHLDVLMANLPTDTSASHRDKQASRIEIISRDTYIVHVSSRYSFTAALIL